MGFGASKIDYKERNFTEQPLEEEEIDILLKALPEENIIDSIESEGREKILRSMSDQKVFNIRGDNIFDYYFTNNKDELKSCMTSHINREGTPCPDEKFNRMITRIPGLVQGPLGEKESEWDTERQSLKSQYNTLDTAKTDLQGKYDTLQQKRQQNFETLALDRFLVNPEIYNKMLMEKMSQKALDIFTKDGDIDINVKEFVEHPSIKVVLDSAYENRKAMLLPFVEVFKKKASDLLNTFTKEVANQIKAQMPALVILFFIVQMKIAAQYSGVDKTKIVPNRTLYNYFSELFDELGIDQNNIDYTFKFITFNAFKKFMDYDLKNDVKGMDLYLQDFLKLIKQFGGDEYLNSLSDFDVNTDMTFDYVHTNSGKPDRSVSEKMCKLYMESKGHGFKQLNYAGAPTGCFYGENTPHEPIKGFYNIKFTEGKCKPDLPEGVEDESNMSCVQKPPDVKNFMITSIGKPDFSVNEFECEQYAKLMGESFGVVENTEIQPGVPSGCISASSGNPNVRYNPTTSVRNCGDFWNGGNSGSQYTCIQKKPKVDHFQRFSVGQPPSKYKEVTSGKQNLSVSESECEAYFTGLGKNIEIKDGDSWSHYPKGCVNDSDIFYYYIKSGGADCASSTKCIQTNPESVSPFECEQYAKSKEGSFAIANEVGNPEGCFTQDGKSMYYNINTDSTSNCGNEHGSDCIQKPIDTKKFRVVRDGLNDRTVSEQQCQAYAKNLKKTMEQGNDTSGCYIAPKSNGIGVYYNKETGKGKCYMNGKTDFRMCIQRPLTKEDFSKVNSGKPLSNYKEIKSGRPDMSVSEEECKAIAGFQRSDVWSEIATGCFKNNTDDYYYNTETNTNDCYSDNKHICIQKNNRYVSEKECKKYAELSGKKGFQNTEWDSYPNGCFDNTTGGIYFNKGTADCATDRLCIEKALTKEDFKKEDFRKVSSGNPTSKYKQVTSGQPNSSVSQEECKAYAKSINKWGKVNSYDSIPSGCFRNAVSHPNTDVYYNTHVNNLPCVSDRQCIQKNNRYVSEQQCKAYAKLMGVTNTNTVQSFTSSRPSGCFHDISDKKVYLNVVNNSKECSSDYNCIEKALTKEDFKTVSSGNPTSKYKDVTSGKPDMSVSETECNSPFPSATYTDKPSGCIKYGSNIRWNKNTNTNSCLSSTPCVQKNPKYINEKDCKAYGESIGKWDKSGSFDNVHSGCLVWDAHGTIFYNKHNNNKNCRADGEHSCIQLK